MIIRCSICDSTSQVFRSGHDGGYGMKWDKTTRGYLCGECESSIRQTVREFDEDYVPAESVEVHEVLADLGVVFPKGVD